MSRKSCESTIRCDKCGGVCCPHCPDVPGFVNFNATHPDSQKHEVIVVCIPCVNEWANGVLASKYTERASGRLPPPPKVQ